MAWHLYSESGAISTPSLIPIHAGDTVVTAGHQRLQKDGTPLRVVDLSQPGGAKPGQAAAPAGAASAAAGGPAPVAGPQAGKVPAASAGKPGPASGKGMALSGPNPCLRGADAAR